MKPVKVDKSMTKFERNIFDGLNPYAKSNKYLRMDRVAEDKIVVKVAKEHVFPTRYGYGLILDRNHVVFIKDWQVNTAEQIGCDVLLNREYWKVKEWGEFDDFDTNEENYDFETWIAVAKEQDAVDEDGDKINPVIWRRRYVFAY